MNHSAINGNDVLKYFTARQQSCGKVMFSVVSVCQPVCSQVGAPCDHCPWCHWSITDNMGPPKDMFKLVQFGTPLDHKDPPPQTSVGKAGGWHSTKKSSHLLILSCEVCKFRLLRDDLLLLIIIIQFFTIFKKKWLQDEIFEKNWLEEQKRKWRVKQFLRKW